MFALKLKWFFLSYSGKNICIWRLDVDNPIHQKFLAYIAKNNNGDFSLQALEKLTNQNILADVAKNAKCIDVRNAAIIKLTTE